jgi:hypothetical protein
MTSCLPANQLAPAVQDGEQADREAITAIGIVIPARNEQAYLGRCLDAIRAAVTHLRSSAYPAIEIRTLVVLDSCTDRTARNCPLLPRGRDHHRRSRYGGRRSCPRGTLPAAHIGRPAPAPVAG